jgi:hypothetical protein
MIANDKLDHTLAIACLDLDGDRARLALLRDSVIERLGRGDQDVENLVLGQVLVCQPEPEMSAKQKRLGRPSRKPQAKPC